MVREEEICQRIVMLLKLACVSLTYVFGPVLFRSLCIRKIIFNNKNNMIFKQFLRFNLDKSDLDLHNIFCENEYALNRIFNLSSSQTEICKT